MEREVIYSRYTSFPVGLCNGISSLYCFCLQCKVKFQKVHADTHSGASLLSGSWCVVRVFQLFVVLCENSLWYGVGGERPVREKSCSQESWNQRNAWGCEKRPPVSWLQTVSTQVLEKVIWKKWGVRRMEIFTLQWRISIVSFQV